MELCRLIYKSVASAEIVSNETLRDIETKAHANNAARDITGLLVHTGRTFLQVLEGAPSNVTELFGKIWSDRRHGQLQLITCEPTASRLFDQWGMRLADLYDLPGERRMLMAEKYACRGGEIIVPTDLHLIYAFLLDARQICLSQPWHPEQSESEQSVEDRVS